MRKTKQGYATPSLARASRLLSSCTWCRTPASRCASLFKRCCSTNSSPTTRSTTTTTNLLSDSYSSLHGHNSHFQHPQHKHSVQSYNVMRYSGNPRICVPPWRLRASALKALRGRWQGSSGVSDDPRMRHNLRASEL